MPLVNLSEMFPGGVWFRSWKMVYPPGPSEENQPIYEAKVALFQPFFPYWFVDIVTVPETCTISRLMEHLEVATGIPWTTYSYFFPNNGTQVPPEMSLLNMRYLLEVNGYKLLVLIPSAASGNNWFDYKELIVLFDSMIESIFYYRQW